MFENLLPKFETTVSLNIGKSDQAIERLAQVFSHQGAAITHLYPNALLCLIRANQLKFSLIPYCDEIEVHARLDLSATDRVTVDVRRLGFERIYWGVSFALSYFALIAAFLTHNYQLLMVPIALYLFSYAVAKLPLHLSYLRLIQLMRSVTQA